MVAANSYYTAGWITMLSLMLSLSDGRIKLHRIVWLVNKGQTVIIYHSVWYQSVFGAQQTCLVFLSPLDIVTLLSCITEITLWSLDKTVLVETFTRRKKTTSHSLNRWRYSSLTQVCLIRPWKDELSRYDHLPWYILNVAQITSHATLWL